jgi:hypothetical protein
MFVPQASTETTDQPIARNLPLDQDWCRATQRLFVERVRHQLADSVSGLPPFENLLDIQTEQTGLRGRHDIRRSSFIVVGRASGVKETPTPERLQQKSLRTLNPNVQLD